MKLSKRILSVLLAAGMLFTSVPAHAFDKPANAVESLQNGYSSSEDAYAIYPVPQSSAYPEAKTAFTLGTEVQVISEDGIDKYTNAFLSEILSNYDRTETKGTAIGGANQILLGIKGSGKAVDAWASKNLTLKDSELFTKTDAYLVSAKNGSIVILGKDTDAVYYGLATLQMMFSSFNGTKFPEVQIEDYASMEMRGFIEGMYSIWDYGSRESLMRFARDYKMNTYMYASKDDSYHKNDTLYPDAEIQKIKDLVKVGEETKVEYGWSIHLSYFWGASGTFDEKFNRLMAKFQQLYDAGVRNFAMLNDDFGGGEYSEILRLLNKFDDEFIQTHDGCSNLVYCMKGYNKAWSGDGSELESLKQLNETVYLYWTGDDVNAPITQSTVDFLKERTDGRIPVIWLNYPVNEHAKSGLFLGPINHYARNNVTGLKGVVSNPSRYAEANKVGLFQLAALFWNNHGYEEQAETIWEESFKYLQPEVYESYLTIARNVANCPNSTRVASFPESEYIKDELASLKAKIDRGQKISNDPNTLKIKNEFSNMLTAVDTFRNNCSNENLIDEMDPWLNSLTDVATAGKASLDALLAMEAGDIATAWEGLGEAGDAMDTYDTYLAYQGGSNMALAGSKRLIPFVQSSVLAAKNQLIPFLQPGSTEFTPSFYAVLAGKEIANSSNTAKVFDGDLTTAVQFNDVHDVGDYFGVDLGRVLPVQSIDILQGTTDEDVDYFHNAVLEYSADTETWTTIQEYDEDATPQHIAEENLDINARFIRLRLTKKGTANKGSYWTHIREITINGNVQKEPAYGLYASDNISAEVVRDKLTYSIQAQESIRLEPGQYIGIKLEELSGLNTVTADSSLGLTLQYSENGVIWNEMPQNPDGTAARYVRLCNTTTQSVTLPSEFLSVNVYSSSLKPSVIEKSAEFSTLNTGSGSGGWEALFDGVKDGTNGSFIWTNTAQVNGQYITVDLGKETPVYDLAITQKKGNPKFYNAAFYLSTQNGKWGDPITTISNNGTTVTGADRTESGDFIEFRKNDLNGQRARYLKIQVTGGSGYFLRIDEIEFNTSVPNSETPVSQLTSDTLTGDLNKIIDGNITTVYTSPQPSDGTASLTYHLTENTDVTSITFLQNAKAITNAVVKANIFNGITNEEKTLGTLNAASNSFYLKGDAHVLSLTVTWPKGTTPCLYEILTNSGEAIRTITIMDDGEEIASEICPQGRAITLPEPGREKAGFVFGGWSDGTATYPAGASYIAGANDVTLTAVWNKIVISVSPKNASLTVGQTLQLTRTITPAEADEKEVIWSSGNAAVATVDANGLVSAKSAGTAVITVKIKDTDVSDTCTVTVNASSSGENPPLPPEQQDPVIEENKTYSYEGLDYKVSSLDDLTVEVPVQKNAALTKIKVPDTIVLGQKTYKVTSVAANAFKNCKRATSATIGKYVTTIGKNAFSGCVKLKKVTIKSAGLKTIGTKAFYQCKALKSIVIKSKKLKTVGKNAFKGIHKKAVIKVPAAKLRDYKKTLRNKGQQKSVKIKK